MLFTDLIDLIVYQIIYLLYIFYNASKNLRYCVIIAKHLRRKEGLEETIKSCDQIAPRAVRSILWKMYSVLGLCLAQSG